MGNKKRWAIKWAKVINIKDIGYGLHPDSLIAIWVPSPQSIKILFPLYLNNNDVKYLFGNGNIPPVPNKQASNIFLPFFA